MKLRLRDFTEKTFSDWTKEQDALPEDIVNTVLRAKSALHYCKDVFPAYRAELVKSSTYSDWNEKTVDMLFAIEQAIKKAGDDEHLLLNLQGFDAQSGTALNILMHWTYTTQIRMRYGLGYEELESQLHANETVYYTMRFLVRYADQVTQAFNEIRYYDYDQPFYTIMERKCTFASDDTRTLEVTQTLYEKTWLTYLEIRRESR